MEMNNLLEIFKLQEDCLNNQIVSWQEQLMIHEARLQEEDAEVLKIKNHLVNLEQHLTNFRKLTSLKKKQLYTLKLARDENGRFLPSNKISRGNESNESSLKNDTPNKKRRKSDVGSRYVPLVKQTSRRRLSEVIQSLKQEKTTSLDRSEALDSSTLMITQQLTGKRASTLKKENVAIQQRKVRARNSKRPYKRKMKLMMELSSNYSSTMDNSASSTLLASRKSSRASRATTTRAFLSYDAGYIENEYASILPEMRDAPKNRRKAFNCFHALLGDEHQLPSSPESLDVDENAEGIRDETLTSARIRQYRHKIIGDFQNSTAIDDDVDIIN